MEGFQAAGIYVLAIFLYTLPCILLWAAWKRETGTDEPEFLYHGE
jgi:hypothetical protein